MNKTEKMIIQLAKTCRKPDEFIYTLEKFPIPPNEKDDFFFQIGNILYKYSYFILALNSWNNALKYCIKDRNRTGISACYANLGIAYDSLGDYAKAIEYHKKALTINQKMGDRSGQATCYTNLGVSYDRLGDHGKAIEYNKKALTIAKELGNHSGEAKCYTNLGIAYDSLGNHGKAIEYHKKALTIDKKTGDPYGISRCYTNLGSAYRSLGDYEKAIEYHKKALTIDKKTGDRTGISACYANLGNAYDSLGDYAKAIEYHKKALTINQKMGDRSGQAKCYTNLGNAYDSLGDYEKAIEYHKKALTISKEIDDRSRISACYTNLGNAYHRLGDYRKAIEYHKKSLTIRKEIGDRAGEAICYTNLGIAYDSLGDYGKAIEYHKKALTIDEETDDRAGISACYTNLGNAYNSLGDYRKAIEYHKKALTISKEIGDRTTEAKCYGNLGNAYRILGDSRKAIEYHKKALTIRKEIGDRAGEATCYGGLGSAYGNLGDYGKAIEYHKKALTISKEIDDRSRISACYTNLGIAYRILGDYGKAIEYHKKALTIDEKIGDRDSERICNLNLCKCYFESNPELASEYCKHSIELSELISGKLVEDPHKIGFYAKVSEAYQYMVPLCLKTKEGKREAFEYVERSKSRAFLDLLAATEIKPTTKLTSKLESLLADEEKYLAKLREIQTRHLRQTKVIAEPGEVEKIREKLDQIYGEIKKFEPEYVFTRKGRPLPLNTIQHMLSSQKRDAVLIEYFTTKDEAFIFVVSSRDKELHIETVAISAEKLWRYLQNYWREVVNYPKFGDIGDTWLALGSYLIEPISKHLMEDDLIYFVPYDLLHYLPLHALHLNGEPLIRKHPVAYSPNASLIRYCKNKGSGKLQSCASFGMVFEEESKDIANLFKTIPFNGYRATKNKVRETCTDKDVIHFSCHGYFNNVNPLSSGIKLFDGVLTAREIFDMRLNTELVTLSACQTGLNKRSSADELIGLTRAFIYAGAPSVIVSLWSVNARSTQELMLEFYTLLKNGTDKAIALQEAQKKIMNKKEYSHPYYWAPFLLVGDWK